jgi:hypothetical protein
LKLTTSQTNIIEDDSLHTIDFWGMVNWYVVTSYWTILYQFGDIAPTTYQQGVDGWGLWSYRLISYDDPP